MLILVISYLSTIPHILFSFSRLVCYFKLRKCRQILHDVVFIIKGLNNLSTSIAPQLTSLSSFMSKKAQRRFIEQKQYYPSVRKYWSRDRENKTSYFDYLEHHVPLLGSEIFNEDKRIDSINSGLEFRAGDQESSEIGQFSKFIGLDVLFRRI